MSIYPKLTYEQYKQKQEQQAEELSYEYRHQLRMKLPEEVKELYDYEFMPFSEIEKLEEKYSLTDDSEAYAALSEYSHDVILGLISLEDLPTFLEREGEMDRYVALQCAIKLSHRIFPKCAQYLDYIGSEEDIEYHIRRWKDELLDELYKLCKARS